MKLLSLLATVLLFSTVMFANEPFKTETLEVGGSVAYHHYGGNRFNNYDGESRTEVKLLPEFGYFVTDGLSIGLVTGYERDEIGDWANQTLSVGYRVAYYFLPKPKGSPYAATSYRYGQTKYEYNDRKTMTRDFAVGMGYLFLIHNDIGLTTELDYVADSYRYEYDDYYYGPTNRKYDGRRWEILVGFKIFVH